MARFGGHFGIALARTLAREHRQVVEAGAKDPTGAQEAKSGDAKTS